MNSKRKGNAGEHAFAHWLESHGMKAMRNAMSGGSVWKGDIGNDQNFCFEVKTAKSVNLKKTWAQVNRDSGMSHAVPVVAIHLDGMPKDSWLMAMHSEDWIDAIKQPIDLSQNQLEQTESRELKYAIEMTIRALKGLLKLLIKDA